MKPFSDVLSDIEKLKGLELNSIRKGAEITITEVDWDQKRIYLTNSNSVNKSRPFEELEKLWEAACKKVAIHVDSELGGSGSSRNQPETILANLPYFEWLRYKNKKHLALVKKSSHNFGTLKKMDAVATEEAKILLKELDASKIQTNVTQIIIVSGDIANHARTLERMLGVAGKAVSQGVYDFDLPSSKLRLASSSVILEKIPEGTYLVNMNPVSMLNGKTVNIAGLKYTIELGKGLFLLHQL